MDGAFPRDLGDLCAHVLGHLRIDRDDSVEAVDLAVLAAGDAVVDMQFLVRDIDLDAAEVELLALGVEPQSLEVQAPRAIDRKS